MMRFGAAVLAYIVPTFFLGFVWHLILFEGYYDRLAMYREDILIPFGLFSMLIQAILFAWLYDKAFAGRPGSWLSRGLFYAVIGACCRGASRRSPSPRRT